MTIEELLLEVQRLPELERQRFRDELDKLEHREEDWEKRRAARRRFLSHVGHSGCADVSSDKYKHLAEIYADDHEPK